MSFTLFVPIAKAILKSCYVESTIIDSEDHIGLLLPTSTQLFNLQALPFVSSLP